MNLPSWIDNRVAEFRLPFDESTNDISWSLEPEAWSLIL